MPPRKTPLAVIQPKHQTAADQHQKRAAVVGKTTMGKKVTPAAAAAVAGKNEKPVSTTTTTADHQEEQSSGSGDNGMTDKSFPMVRFEKLEPHQRFFVDLNQVYSNGREYSVEEIRARAWYKKQEREVDREKTRRLEQEVQELKEQLRQLQASLGKKPFVPLNPLNTPRDSAGHSARDPDQRIVAAAVSGFAVPVLPVPTAPASDFVIYEDSTTNVVPVVPVVKPAPASFEIYTDPTDQVTVPVPAAVPNKTIAVAAAASFEIFQDESTDQVAVPVNKEKPQVDKNKNKRGLRQISPQSSVAQEEQEEEQERMGDRMDTFCDFSINPIAHPGGSNPRASFTFILPSETEFLAKAISSSTPAAGSKKHVSRLPALVKSLQPAVQQQQQTEKTELLTGKLDTIVETSREYKSCSSSSGSSGAHTTRGTTMSQRTRFLSGPGNEQNPVIISDPFDAKLITNLLDDLDETIDKRKGFKLIRKCLPKIKESLTKLPLGPTGDMYIVQELKDEGAYAKVYTAQIECGDDGIMDGYSCTSNNNTAISDIQFNKFFALKICRPANMWEFYIVDEMHKRLSRKQGIDIELSVQMGNPAVLYQDASVLVDEYCPNGTLMKIVNVYKKAKKSFPKSMTAYFALELMLVIRQIHECDIIHADVKPDNVLILNFPTREEVISVIRRTSAVKLIDFGRGIDMSLFPKDTLFMHHVETKGSACPEMLDNLPWSHQIDWFGFLDCMHVMIFQDYIDIYKDPESGFWSLNKKVNKRNHLKDMWEPLFDQLLNLPSSLSSSSPSSPEDDGNVRTRQQIVDQAIADLTSYTRDHLDEIYKESMEMEAFVERLR